MHIVSRVGIGKVPPSSPLYLDVGGAVNFDSTLQVIGQTTVNSLISSQLASNLLVYESRIPGEANVLFSINRDGKIEWGLGGLFSTDVNLYRSGVNTLRTNSSLIVDQSLTVGDATTDTATFNARIASNFDPLATNTYSLGQSTLRWQNLWLSVKLTSVDGLFTGDLQVDNNVILGNSSSDTLTINSTINTSLIPTATNSYDLGSSSLKWRSLWLGTNLQVDGNTIFGDSTSDTVTFNALVASQLTPFANNAYDLGSSSLKWRSLWLAGNLQVDGNTILGDSTSDTLTINSTINTSLIPTATNSYDLGSSSLKWRSLWLAGNLQVDGNTILGDDPSDTLTINAGFASPINPSVDNTYDLGTSSFRWRALNTGPTGVLVRNDTTNTQKVNLYFNSGIAYLTSSSSSLKINTNGNNGLTVDTTGKVGINVSSETLTRNFNVIGTSDFSDTVYFSKASGYGLRVTAVAGIEGSLESANTQKALNIGVNAETEFLNLGTGALTKVINIGTGTGKTTINIGGPSDIISISGTVTASKTIESFVSDKTFTLNVGGLNATAQNSGLIVEEAASTLLSVSDPTWQSGNTVRYLCTNTGNIKIGSVVLISGFLADNNGQFTVTGLSANTYIEVANAAITDSSFNQIGTTGTCTNPSEVAKILVSPSRDSWDIYSPTNPSKYFRITNLGENVELKGTSDGIAVNAAALIPNTANLPLGSLLKPWNAYLNDVNVYGNTIIGNTFANTLNIKALTKFENKVDSDIIPNGNNLYSLGGFSDRWKNLFVNNLTSYISSTFTGTVNLGLDTSTGINVNGLINTNLLPANNTLSLGSLSNPWNSIYISTIAFPVLGAGSVLFINKDFLIADNNANFFWNDEYRRLFIGQNTGDYILDIKKYQSDSIRIRNSENSSSLALRTKETLFSETAAISNGPVAVETASIALNSVNKKVAQTFTFATSKKIQKVGLQLITSAPLPLLAPYLSGKMYVAIHQVVAGVIQTSPIATSKPLTLDGFPLGFQTSITNFDFFDVLNLSAGDYALVAFVQETPAFGASGYLDNCVKIAIPGNATIDPAPTSKTAIPVNVINTDSISQVLYNTVNELTATSDFIVNANPNILRVTNAINGATTDVADYNSSFGFEIITQGNALNKETTEISVSLDGNGLNNSTKYWFLNSANDTTSYYVWYNVTDGTGTVDPELPSIVTVTNTINGVTTDAVDYDSGVIINVSVQGDISTSEITNITMPANATSLDGTIGKYWLINSATDATEYYVWYNVTDGSGTVDPAPSGKTSIQVDVVLADNSAALALKTTNALNLIADFNAIKKDFTGIQVDVLIADLLEDVTVKTVSTLNAMPDFDAVRVAQIEITNTANGTTTDAANFNAGVSATVLTQGNASTAEVTKIILTLDGAGLDGIVGKYWTISSANNAVNYYVWYKVVTLSSSFVGGSIQYFDNTNWNELTPSQDLSFKIYELVDLSTPVSNKFEFTDILQFGANTYANVGNGTSTAVLELSSSAIKLLGAVSHTTTSVSSATYSVAPTDTIIYVDTSVSGCTITLPSAATKRLLVIKDIGNNASTAGRSIQLTPASGQYFEFNTVNTPFIMDSDGASLTIHSNGSDRWYII